MDEILIGEKKYVSSKRAAKVTGYAKDYIGQLCREGRVPARLVGRSWYVLESAIHDHRFGDQKIDQEKALKNVAETEPIPLPTWESPRYEASSAEIMPPVSRLRDIGESVPIKAVNEENAVSQRLQDSWKAWFDRIADTQPVALATLTQPKEQEETEEIKEAEVESTPQEIQIQEVQETNVPIHTVYQEPPEELLPRHHRREIQPPDELQEAEKEQKREGKGAALRTIQITGASLAVLVAVLAVIGSGYFDKYILSSSQLRIIAGVTLYNK